MKPKRRTICRGVLRDSGNGKTDDLPGQNGAAPKKGKLILPEILSVEKSFMSSLLGVLSEEEHISLFNVIKKVQGTLE